MVELMSAWRETGDVCVWDATVQLLNEIEEIV